jgi:hypothetical protein
MIPVIVEIPGQQDLMAAFVKLDDLYDDLSPVFEAVGEEALKDIQHKFDVGGPGWPPHAESTRKKLVGPTRILRDSDTLYDSFQEGAAGNIFRVSAREGEFGSDIFYGIFHQEGRGHNPERKIIDAKQQDEEKYNRIASEIQIERIRRLGFEVN